MKVRVRIAPSPTGYLHIGTARTALFNYLFAKHHGGQFILRIEDTDLERSDKKYEKDIIEGLKWLGLDWDEGPIDVSAEGDLFSNKYKGEFGPYRQTERLDIYEKYLKQLLDKGFAYYCYCSKEELELDRQAMLTQGLAPKYSGGCRNGKPFGATQGEPKLIRFKIPDCQVSFHDMIRGEISFNMGIMGDIVIAKDLRTPLYNFAVVVDDQEMQITHVIRGEDHINNTPKQILMIEALEFNKPHYAHLPLILDPDRSKMSKRFATTSIAEYREQGFLPEAIINFLALLGWHPAPERASASLEKIRSHGDGAGPKEKEVFSLQELVKEFDLSRAQKAGAVFNIEKLNWLNAQYIKKMKNEELAERLNLVKSEQNLKIIRLSKDRMNKLSDFKMISNFFFKLPEYLPELLSWRGQNKADTVKILKELKGVINDPDAIMKLANEKGKGEVLWPLRVALSGLDASPGPLEILDALGEEEAEKRLEMAISKLK